MKRNHNIENDVCMGRTAYNTKIVKGQLLIEPVDDIGDLMAQLIDLRIIGDDRVHMDDSTAGKLLLQLALYVINQIVQLHKAALGIDLRMQGDHPPSGTVIVNEQVVNAHDLWMGKHNAADFCDKLRVGSLTEQRIDGIPGRAYAGIKDEDCDQKTAPAVDGKTENPSNNRRKEDDGGSEHIAEGIRRCCVHRRAVDGTGNFVIIKIHIELDENGNDQNQKNNRRNFRQGRVQDLLKGGFGKLRCHDEDNGRNGKPGEIFDSSVPIRMVGVCFLSAHLKSDQRNDRRTGIRQVVECVRSDGDGMADHTGDDL